MTNLFQRLLSLGIDTSGRFMNLSVSSSSEEERDFCWEEEVRNHACRLPLAIEEVLKKSSIGLKEINAVGIVAGPGSFTGLRVGMSTALALKMALKIPIYKFSSLYCLAKYCGQKGKIGAFIDARKGEFYFQSFERDSCTLNPLGEPSTIKYDKIREYSKVIDWGVVLKGGCGVEISSFSNIDVFMNLNLAKIASREALQKLSLGIKGDKKLIPIYIREADAITQM